MATTRTEANAPGRRLGTSGWRARNITWISSYVRRAVCVPGFPATLVRRARRIARSVDAVDRARLDRVRSDRLEIVRRLRRVHGRASVLGRLDPGRSLDRPIRPAQGVTCLPG